MEVKVTAPDLPGQSFKGEISFIGAELDQDRKSVEVRVRAANPNLKVKVGMDGVSEMGVANKTHEALLVPFEAVLRDGDSRFVYVLDGSVAEKREVVTGSFYEGMVEIRDGLKASDQVVTRGAESLKEDEEFVKVSS
jgi:RND family efflux transporter MFP subunit